MTAPTDKSDGRQRVLVVEDSRVQARKAQLVLEEHGFEAQLESTAAAALSALAGQLPDLVLLDVNLPDSDGRDLVRRIRQSASQMAGVPIILLTGSFKEVGDVVYGLEAGANDYLVKPVADAVLVARIKACLRARQQELELTRLTRELGAINDIGRRLTDTLDPRQIAERLITSVRTALGYPRVHIVRLEGSRLVVAAGTELPPDASFAVDGSTLVGRSILTGALAHEVESSGSRLRLLGGEESNGVAVPFNVAGEVAGAIEIALPRSAGSSNWLALRTLASLVGVAFQNARLFSEMQELASGDELTQVLNRRAILARLESEVSRAVRHGRDLGVLCIDLDQLKPINDRLGHAAGDRVLQQFAADANRGLRSHDALGRTGGDEFVAVLPETDAQAAAVVAERVCRRCATLDLSDEQGQKLPISASVGFATLRAGESLTWRGLLDAADQALYRAKAKGRNCASG